MIHHISRWLVACGLFALLACSGKVTDARADKQQDLVDKPAPEIPAGTVNIGGKAAKLSDLKGKVVLIDFWAVWCPPCVASIPTLREWSDSYKDKGVVILGVTDLEGQFGSFDKEKGRPVPMKDAPVEKEEEMLKGFSDYHRINYQLVGISVKDSEKVTAAYFVDAIPLAVLVDRKGVVRLVRGGNSPANKKAIKEMIETLLEEK